MKDATLIKSAAMPNAANTTTTGVIALPQQSTRPFTTKFRVRLSNTVATGANSKNITYTLRGSNEANGANSVALRTFTVGGNGTNHAASAREVNLDPESDKRYLIATALGEANGGDAGDGTFSIEIIA
jgi:predicted RecA/RadA family phage recombinase